MRFTPGPRQKERAVQYLLEKIPAETLDSVHHEIEERGSYWWVRHHHGLGLGVRNVLRKGGFNWGDRHLDSVWSELVEEAAKRKRDYFD